jgi:Flp pilus assembly protein TadD
MRLSMRTSTSVFTRALLACLVLGLSQAGGAAQTGRGAALSLVQQVRNALGHGAVAEARALVDRATNQTAGRDLAAAIVDIFEGKDEEARAKLMPLARATPGGDAALELGLLEMRHGRRTEARQILDPLVAVRQFSNPDDYFRLARAAIVAREFLLANDAFQRTKDVPRADIQSAWGDFYVLRHRVDLAAESYRDALAADQAWVPAHVGMARAFGDANPPAARAALETARKLAPEHPDVLLLTAERLDENTDLTGASEVLDRLARVRVNSLDEAALRVAIAYHSGDRAALDAALARVTAIDPRSALGLRAAGQQAARDYRFDEASEFARKAVGLDDDDADAHADLGLYLLRTGDETGARIELERAWRLDVSNQMTKNLLDMLDKLEKFDVFPDGDLVFKFDKAEAPVLKTYALPLGRAAYTQFVERYGFKPKGPILIEVFPRHDDFAVRTIGLPGIAGALGACFGRVVSMDSPKARPQGEFSWHATLWHEMAHVFSLQLSDYRVPRWLTEGISVYEEHRRQAGWGRELTLQFARQLKLGKTFGVKGLPEAFKNPENFALAYFEASLVVEHLVELNGDAGLRTLLQAYAGRASDADAFAKAFGRNLDQVEASYKAFVERKYAALRDALADPPSDVKPDDVAGLKSRAEAAPGNYVSQWTAGQALVKAGDAAGARVLLERAAKLAPPATGDDSPRALLARLALDAGDPARARQELRALLAYDHSNVNAARRLLTLSNDAAAEDDLDFALRVIADIDPFDNEVHSRLGRRLLAKGNHAEALVEFQAALAIGPTNLAEAQADLSEAFLKLGRRDEARRAALAALKEAPTFARAQDLLLAALGREEF